MHLYLELKVAGALRRLEMSRCGHTSCGYLLLTVPVRRVRATADTLTIEGLVSRYRLALNGAGHMCLAVEAVTGPGEMSIATDGRRPGAGYVTADVVANPFEIADRAMRKYPARIGLLRFLRRNALLVREGMRRHGPHARYLHRRRASHLHQIAGFPLSERRHRSQHQPGEAINLEVDVHFCSPSLFCDITSFHNEAPPARISPSGWCTRITN